MRFTTCFATRDERRRHMPGDGVVDEPALVVTHAITIDAAPDRVWPWLAQMGSYRGGWYSYDLVDNGGRESAEEVLPEHQRIRVGDVLPAIPGAKDAFRVARLDSPRDLVLSVPGPGGIPVASWEHLLAAIGPRRTRLVTRARVRRDWLDASPARVRVAAVLGHRIMEARHLRGIKRRAELPDPPVEE